MRIEHAEARIGNHIRIVAPELRKRRDDRRALGLRGYADRLANEPDHSAAVRRVFDGLVLLRVRLSFSLPRPLAPHARSQRDARSGTEGHHKPK